MSLGSAICFRDSISALNTNGKKEFYDWLYEQPSKELEEILYEHFKAKPKAASKYNAKLKIIQRDPNMLLNPTVQLLPNHSSLSHLPSVLLATIASFVVQSTLAAWLRTCRSIYCASTQPMQLPVWDFTNNRNLNGIPISSRFFINTKRILISNEMNEPWNEKWSEKFLNCLTKCSKKPDIYLQFKRMLPNFDWNVGKELIRCIKGISLNYDTYYGWRWFEIVPDNLRELSMFIGKKLFQQIDNWPYAVAFDHHLDGTAMFPHLTAITMCKGIESAVIQHSHECPFKQICFLAPNIQHLRLNCAFWQRLSTRNILIQLKRLRYIEFILDASAHNYLMEEPEVQEVEDGLSKALKSLILDLQFIADKPDQVKRHLHIYVNVQWDERIAPPVKLYFFFVSRC